MWFINQFMINNINNCHKNLFPTDFNTIFNKKIASFFVSVILHVRRKKIYFNIFLLKIVKLNLYYKIL